MKHFRTINIVEFSNQHYLYVTILTADKAAGLTDASYF